MANSKKWNIRPSHMLFSISAALAVLFGALYLFWPIAPYHEEIIGMSFHDLDALNSDVAGLMKTLVNVVGLSFLAIGISLAYTAKKPGGNDGHASSSRGCWRYMLSRWASSSIWHRVHPSS